MAILNMIILSLTYRDEIDKIDKIFFRAEIE